MCQTKCCRRPRNLLIMAIIWVILAAVFLVLAIMIKPLIQNMIQDQAKTATTLKGSNFDAWQKIPGKNNIMVLRNYYLYNCSNVQGVYFNQEEPRCYEQDPVQFYEDSTYVNPDFLALPRPTDLSQKNEAVRVGYDVLLQPNADYPNLNASITIPNQALFGIWQGAGNQERYGQGMTALYGVISGMQTSLVDQATNALFQQDQPFVSNFETFQSNVEPTNIFTSTQIQHLWDDQYYGFNNKSDVSGIDQVTRISLWTSLCPNSSQTSELVNATTKNQFKLYFDIAHDALEQFLEQLICPGFNLSLDPVYLQACLNPAPGKTCDSLDVAYGQWTQGSVTQINQQESIAIADPTILGYPEMSYFLSAYFKAGPNPYIPTGAEAQFDSISFTGETYFSLINYMNLTEQCLLYLDTMRQLLFTGDNFNVTAHTSKDGEGKLVTDFTYFANIAKRLNVTEIEAYVVYAYVDTLIAKTLLRTAEGGNGYLLALSNLAPTGVKKQVSEILAYNFPRALYALWMHNTIPAGDCKARVERYLPSVSGNTITTICATPELNFESPLSFYTWVKFYSDQIPQTASILVSKGLSPIQLGEDILSISGNFTKDIQAARKGIKDWYSQQDSPCNYLNTANTYCSDFEIAYLQWGFSNITLNLPSQLTSSTPKSNSAQALLKMVTGSSTMQPEYYAFLNASSSQDLATYTPKELMTQLDGSHLYNMKKVQDLFLDQSIENGVLNSTHWRDYLRYSTLEFSFGGLFKTVTIYEALHGYVDPLLDAIKHNPLYQGGTPYMNSKLALINPDRSYMAFFTGADDYAIGKEYAEYHNSSMIRIPKQVAQGNGSYYEEILVNPWRDDVPVKGTDASKFSPMIDSSEEVWAFVSDIMIPLGFSFIGQGEKDGLKTYQYELLPNMLYNSTRNPVNAQYYMDKFEGFANLTSYAGAPGYASQPRYLGVPEGQDGLQLATLLDKHGNKIVPDHDRDFNNFKLEYYTGAQIEGYQRLQSNLFMENNLLFNMTTMGNSFNFMVPLEYVQRSTDLSSAQLDKLFGSLKTAMNLQVPLIIVFAILCALFLALAIWMFVRRRKQMRRESYLLMDDLSSVGGKQTVRSHPAEAL